MVIIMMVKENPNQAQDFFFCTSQSLPPLPIFKNN